jgi:hypothetical protein
MTTPSADYGVIEERSVYDTWCSHPDHLEERERALVDRIDPEHSLYWIGCLTSRDHAEDVIRAHIAQKHCT